MFLVKNFDDRMVKLIELLREQNSQHLKTIVFVKSAFEAEYVANSLIDKKFKAASIGRFLNFSVFKFQIQSTLVI